MESACDGEPYGITAGPDGAMWFTETGADLLGRITARAPAGTVRFTTLPAQASAQYGHGNSFEIVTGSDGALWFTRGNTFSNAATIDRITTSFAVTEQSVSTLTAYGITAGPDGALWFSGFQGVPEDLDIGRVPTNGSAPTYFPDSKGGDQNGTIATGSDGALWYTDSFPNVTDNDVVNIGRVTTAGVQTSFPTTTIPVSITAGPDGALWYTDYVSGGQEYTNQIARISTGGTITNYTLPIQVTSSGLKNPSGVIGTDDGITSGPDGALWFTDPEGNSIGRITTTGTVTEYPIPTANSHPEQIATGPDGALWFTEVGTNKIGRVTTTGTFTEYTLCATQSTMARLRAR